MKRIYLGKNERVVAVVPEDCAGPGWSNSVVWVYIRDYLGNTRSECLQIADQTPEMLTLFEHGAIMHRALVGAVPTVVGSGPADADFEALLAEQEPLGLSRAERHRAALERVEHYAGTPPDPDLASTWAMLKSAWERVAERHAND